MQVINGHETEDCLPSTDVEFGEATSPGHHWRHHCAQKTVQCTEMARTFTETDVI